MATNPMLYATKTLSQMITTHLDFCCRRGQPMLNKVSTTGFLMRDAEASRSKTRLFLENKK